MRPYDNKFITLVANTFPFKGATSHYLLYNKVIFFAPPVFKQQWSSFVFKDCKKYVKKNIMISTGAFCLWVDFSTELNYY